MAALSTFPLGSEGMAYVVSELEAGGTFGKLALKSLPLEVGEVFTRLPDSVTLEEAKRFKWGGKLPTPSVTEWKKLQGGKMVPLPNTRDDLIRIISEYLAAPDKVCILKNANAERGDPWLERISVPFAYFGSEVYHFLAGSPSPPLIEATLKSAQAFFLFVGGLTSLGNDPQCKLPCQGGDLSRETIERLVENVEQLFFGSYDSEGYVFWSRGAS